MTDQQNRYTLAEAARLTGLSVEALRLRIRRGKLAAEKGNDGLRVILTSADIANIVAAQQRQRIPTGPVDKTSSTNLLEEAVGILREHLAAREAELERVRLSLEQTQDGRLQDRGRAERAEGSAEGLRAALHVAEAAHESAWARAAAEAEQRAMAEARADAERDARQVAEDRTMMAEDRAILEQEARQAAQIKLAEQRERAARAEGETEGLLEALRIAEAQVAALRQVEAAERQAAEDARAELAAWTVGGPLTRALRAFFRRG